MKKNIGQKQYKPILALLFFSMLISYNNIGYASTIKISDIQSIARIYDNIKVINFHSTDKSDVLYLLEKDKAFTIKAGICDNITKDNKHTLSGNDIITPKKHKITITDNNEKKHTFSTGDKKIKPGSETQNIINLIGGYLRSYFAIENTEHNTASKKITVDILNEEDESIDTFETRTPEIGATLKKSKPNGQYNILELKNIHSKKIKLIEINDEETLHTYLEINGKEIGSYINSDYTLSPGQTLSIELSLDYDTFEKDETTFEDTIYINYEIDGKKIESEIELNINRASPKTKCPKRPEKDCPTCDCSESKTVLIKEEHKFNENMYAGDIQDAIYSVENKSDQTLFLQISDPNSPISRIDTIEKNCSGTLEPKKSCTIKLRAYPTETGEIKQKLRISALDINKKFDLNINVKDGKKLRVTQIPLPLGEIINDKTQLKYRLENRSKETLQIISTYVRPSPTSDHHPAFEITNNCTTYWMSKNKWLEPEDTCEITIIFDQETAEKFGEFENKSINKHLEIKYGKNKKEYSTARTPISIIK